MISKKESLHGLLSKEDFSLLAGLLWAAFLALDLTGLGDSTWVKCAALCVGACNLSILTFFTRWGSWLFCLPSQVLIVLSQEPEKGDLDEKRF